LTIARSFLDDPLCTQGTIHQCPDRRFPPPWSAEVTPNCFIVRDANGQALSYIYLPELLSLRGTQ